jgi:hypothetical protein
MLSPTSDLLDFLTKILYEFLVSPCVFLSCPSHPNNVGKKKILCCRLYAHAHTHINTAVQINVTVFFVVLSFINRMLIAENWQDL